VRPAALVDGRVDFGAPPAAATAERLVAGAFFFTWPAARWWARTMVESSSTASKAVPRTAANRCCQVPFRAQRCARLRTESCLPKRAGSTRQVPPWRRTQSPALRNSRLSAAVQPTSPALPGKCGASFAHAASLSASPVKPIMAKVIVRTP